MFWHFDCDIISLIVLLVVLFDSRRRLNRTLLLNRMFILCVLCGVFACTADIIDSFVCSYATNLAMRTASRVLYYAVIELPILCWVIYAVAMLFRDKPSRMRGFIIALVSLYGCYLLFLLVSLRGGWMFRFLPDGSYVLGSCIFVPYAVSVVYGLFLIAVICIGGRHYPEKRMLLYLAAMPVILMIGTALQVCIPGWLMIMPSFMLVILISYFFIQNQVNQGIVSRLSAIASTDKLTGILNRAATEDAIDALLLQPGGVPCVILMIDLDNLRLINDQLGHLAGDEALRMTAQTLKNCFRSMDIVGRIGGDEFIVFISGIPAAMEPSDIAKKIQDRFLPLTVGNDPAHPVRCSIGVAAGVSGETDRVTLYAQADAALYHAKRTQKGSFAVYD